MMVMTLMAFICLTGMMPLCFNLVPCFPTPFPLFIPTVANAFPVTSIGYLPTVIFCGTPPLMLGCIIPETPLMPFVGPAPVMMIPPLTVGPSVFLVGMVNVLIGGRPVLVCGGSMSMNGVAQSPGDTPGNAVTVFIGL